MFEDQFEKLKFNGEAIEPIFKQYIKNMMNMQHASVQLKSKLPMHDQMSQFTLKHDEFMDHS